MATKYNITAIIYDKRGRVLSIGKNNYIKTHPLMKLHANKCNDDHKEYLHAEVHAITLCKDLAKAHRIVVSRYNNQGEPRLAKPCRICQSAIDATPIRDIRYTISDMKEPLGGPGSPDDAKEIPVSDHTKTNN